MALHTLLDWPRNVNHFVGEDKLRVYNAASTRTPPRGNEGYTLVRLSVFCGVPRVTICIRKCDELEEKLKQLGLVAEQGADGDAATEVLGAWAGFSQGQEPTMTDVMVTGYDVLCWAEEVN